MKKAKKSGFVIFLQKGLFFIWAPVGTTSTVDPAAEDTCHTNVASSSPPPPPPVIDRSLHPQADNCKKKNKNKNKAWSSKTHTKWKFTIRDSTVSYSTPEQVLLCCLVVYVECGSGSRKHARFLCYYPCVNVISK